jgi:hypothetical protein
MEYYDEEDDDKVEKEAVIKKPIDSPEEIVIELPVSTPFVKMIEMKQEG